MRALSDAGASWPRLSFRGGSKRYWAKLSNIGVIFGFASALVAGVWGLFEYVSKQEEERTKYTLALIDDWETKGYRKAYGELREAYAAFVGSLEDSDRLAAASMGQGRVNLLKVFAARMEKDPVRREQIREVVYFFNRLGLCEHASVCSRTTAAIFFDDTVRTFADVFQPYIDKNAEMLPGNKATIMDLSRRLSKI